MNAEGWKRRSFFLRHFGSSAEPAPGGTAPRGRACVGGCRRVGRRGGDARARAILQRHPPVASMRAPSRSRRCSPTRLRRRGGMLLAEPPAGTAGAGEVWAADVTPAIQVLVAEQANRAHNIQQVMDLTGGGREHEANRLRVGRSGLLKELCSWITPLTPANFLLDILTVRTPAPSPPW